MDLLLQGGPGVTQDGAVVQEWRTAVNEHGESQIS